MYVAKREIQDRHVIKCKLNLSVIYSDHRRTNWWAGGAADPQKIKKMNVFGQKIDAIRAKINHTNLTCA